MRPIFPGRQHLSPMDVARSLAIWMQPVVSANCDKEVKPEGMAILGSHSEGSDEVYRLAIFSDGMCDGGPVIVDAMTAAQ